MHELAARRPEARPRPGVDGRARARRARRARAGQRPLPDELLGHEGVRRLRVPARGRRGADLPGGLAGRGDRAVLDDRHPTRRRLLRRRPTPCAGADARGRAGGREGLRQHRARAVARDAGKRPHGRRADDVHEGLVRRLAGRGGRDAGPGGGARAQDGAGDRAHAACERDLRRRHGARARRAPSGDDGERGGGDLARLRPRGRHRLGGQGRARARVLARLVGAGHQDVHRHRAPPGGGRRADAVRDLGLRRRLLVRPHEAPLPRRAQACLSRARARAARRVRTRRRPLPAGGESRGARRARPRWHRRDGLRGPADAPDLPRGRRARPRAAVRAPRGGRGNRRRHGAGDRAGLLLARRRRPARRGQLLDHERRSGEAVVVPGRGGAMTGVSELIWTGGLNDAYAIGGHVGLYDTTLRDGEQTVGVVLSPDDKLEIARLLDELGIDRIEAGFPRVSDDDWKAVEKIAAAGLRAEIWGFSRAVPADLEALVELGVQSSVIESPISDLKLDAIGVPREKMLDRITSAMRFAAEHGIHAAFFGVDSTRAHRDFYDRVYKSAVEAGAKEVVVVDTLGIASPEAVADLVGKTKQWVGADVPVHFHGHNDFGLATAAAVAAVRAGATWIHGTINGMGERAGNANLVEVALTLQALYRVDSNLHLDRARGVSARVREMSGYELEPWKPVTGDTLFRRESGAVASQFHDPPSIEPYSSQLVNAQRAIVLGKKSGLDSIRIKAEELGLDLPEDKRADVLARVKELGARKRGLLTDDEFRELVNA